MNSNKIGMNVANRKQRREQQKQINRKIRQRERELRRNIKAINIKADGGYISEYDALDFIEKLSQLNHSQKKKYKGEE